MPLQLANFIDGRFSAPACNAYIDSFNPATNEVNARVPDSDAADISLAVDAAQRAFPAWSRTPSAVRADIMLRIADALDAQREAFALAESQDQGKTLTMARTVDIPRAAANFRYFAMLVHAGVGADGEVRATEGAAVKAWCFTERQPVGVAGLISPWNLPLYLLSWKLAPCIAVGSTCVCKPSEFTSVTAFMLCSILKECGLPDGVVNMVFGTGLRAGKALVSHPRVPLISFTGGTDTGRAVLHAAADHFKHVSLELGGKNPTIVFDDCNVDQAIAGAVRAGFSNQGEICLCGSRLLVHRSVYDEFVARFVERVAALKVGCGQAELADPEHRVDVGALVSKQHYDKVMSYIAMAHDDSSVTIACGGKAAMVAECPSGYFVAPTVITGVKADSRLFQEEIFGPVVTVTPFDTEEEAVQLANCTPYGLSASIWTENIRRAKRVASALDVGTVWVNCWMVRDLHMPFGGKKQSGIGREGGRRSLEFFTEEKTICIAE